MTTKDWKKKESSLFGKSGELFENKKEKSYIVVIYKLPEKWIFRRHRNNYGWNDKFFKTKSQALKFAKSYMRKH